MRGVPAERGVDARAAARAASASVAAAVLPRPIAAPPLLALTCGGDAQEACARATPHAKLRGASSSSSSSCCVAPGRVRVHRKAH